MYLQSLIGCMSCWLAIYVVIYGGAEVISLRNFFQKFCYLVFWSDFVMFTEKFSAKISYNHWFLFNTFFNIFFFKSEKPVKAVPFYLCLSKDSVTLSSLEHIKNLSRFTEDSMINQNIPLHRNKNPQVKSQYIRIYLKSLPSSFKSQRKT